MRHPETLKLSVKNWRHRMIKVFIVVCLVVFGSFAAAQDVKYCKNYQTGEIIVIEAGYPCPSPTSEI